MGDDKPITGKEILEVLKSSEDAGVQEALQKGKVEVASADQVVYLQPWVDRILEACGIEGAFISDESWMGDMLPFFGDREESRQKVVEKLGLEFENNDRIVDVARRLKEANDALEN